MQWSDLPSVEALLLTLRSEFPELPHSLLKAEAVRAIQTVRQAIRYGSAARLPLELAREGITGVLTPSLRPVINATGVVLHTNLGRAPLGEDGYLNLEYDLAAGRRGKRDSHCGPLLQRILGAPAIAVNNNAAAVYLVLHELAFGAEVIVSRGELIEIGDGFRIPDIMRRAGVQLVEVGTTNRTRLEDYEQAITDKTRMLLRVHPSNFHISGFTGKPTLAELAGLSKARQIPLYEDLGSGCLADLRPFGIDEPLVQDSLRAGVDIVSFSGDKLLGGPQAGFIAGTPGLVARVRRNPMFRALRLDKLVLQSLEPALRAVLLERWDEIPALRMIRQSETALRDRAEAFLVRLPAGFGARLKLGRSLIGGGSTPDQSLPAVLIAISAEATKLERLLRNANPPVVARLEDGELLIDLRTVPENLEAALLGALIAVRT